MDSAIIALIASVSVVLQIVVIIMLTSTLKKIATLKKDLSQERSFRPRDRDRDRDPRRNQSKRNFNRNQNHSRSEKRDERKPPSPPQDEETVDQTLRDINLRLKNAERDQEMARRQMTDRNQRDSRRRDRPRGGNRRRSKKSDDSQSRFSSGDSRQAVSAPVSPSTPSEQTGGEKKTETPSGDVQHSRRVVVKRRDLTAGGQGPAAQSPAEGRRSGTQPDTPPAQEGQDNEKRTGGEVTFGRR